MLKNKVVIISVLILLVGAIAYNIYFFYKRMHPSTPSMSQAAMPTSPTPPKREPQKSPPTKTEPEGSSPPSGTSTTRKETTSPVPVVVKKRPLTPTWGRNPFFSPEELTQLAKIEHPDTTSKEKKEGIPVILSGIIIVAKDKMAILNNRVMLEGEKIGEIKLLKIMPSAVWISIAGNRRWIPLPQPHVTLIAQDVMNTPHKVTKEIKQ